MMEGGPVQTIVGMPAAFAYSKYRRTSASRSSAKVIVPPPDDLEAGRLDLPATCGECQR